MTNRKGVGIFMIATDVSADKEDEFNRWYNEEHLAEVTALPGILNSSRYEAVSGGPKYLAVYEMETPEVWDSPEFVKLRDNPTEWTKRMSPMIIGHNVVRYIYRMIHPDRLSDAAAEDNLAPALQIGRMSVPAEHDAEFNDWYNNIYIPGYEAVPGCIRGRRFVSVEGDPKYGTIYELEDTEVSKTDEWLKARESNPKSPEMRAVMTHATGSPAVYRKIFQL